MIGPPVAHCEILEKSGEGRMGIIYNARELQRFDEAK